MRLVWATDIHLNFLDSVGRRFLKTIREQADAFVISGDIAESNDIGDMLCQMDTLLCIPVFLVLGNHDFYRGSGLGQPSSRDWHSRVWKASDTADIEHQVARSGPRFDCAIL